ncbi:family 2 glycoside hydrolase [Scheffersomyces amazonensis]|uniref:family 2 glycoside hydrolase n=1 Tax=Scheffersomyces amazonensis TaxID=1078765 RepID=UPI00315DA9D6
MTCITLKDWYFRQSSSDAQRSDIDFRRWFKAREDTKGNQIHLDLLHNHHIPDPFIDDNEKKVQWVGASNWEYRTSFDIENYDSEEEYYLVFEGLDTFATISLNYSSLLVSDNSFRTYIINVTEYVQPKDNELRIKFKSPLQESRKIEVKNGKYVCWNGETSRLHVRKPQYQFGWDWGPLLLTCGPWRPVKFVSGVLVKDFFIRYELSKFLNRADISVEVNLSLPKNYTPSTIVVKIFDSQNNLIDTILSHTVKSNITVHCSIRNPHLWYPRNYGDQYQYRFELFIDEEKLNEKLVGFRKVELIQDDDHLGQSFYFKINNEPVFIKGSNWIPANSFTSQLKYQDYYEWMDLLIKGNQNLIRIWGGGIYEDDDLYSICDSKGILIWQDFMFACGMYPAYHSFVSNVKQEINDQLTRLRQYSSIIVFVGNNEDYQIAESLKIKYNHHNYSTFPARKFYEDIFPHLVKKMTNGVPYECGSPYSGHEYLVGDRTRGDIHQWNVWHGTQEPYQTWDKLGGRLVSEFGMLALPNFRTLDNAVSDKSQLYPQSYLMDHHNKSVGFERRLALYVMENFALPLNFTLKNWIYITQLMQSDCLSLAYRYWRRLWLKYECGGAIVWQLNDCWPVTSWSIIDFNKVPKLAYYAIKRECASIGIGCYRNLKRIGDPDEPEDLSKQTPLHDYVKSNEVSLDIWGFSDEFFDSLSLEIDLYNTNGDFVTKLTHNDLKLYGMNTIQTFVTKLADTYITEDIIIHIILRDRDGNIIGRTSDWPRPMKYINWQNWYKDLKLDTILIEPGKIKISTNKPVKCLELYFEDDLTYEYSDNGFDIFPNDDQIIEVKGVDEESLVNLKFNHL